jgi:hypothetical protein
MQPVLVVVEKVSQSDTLRIDAKSHAFVMKRGSFFIGQRVALYWFEKGIPIYAWHGFSLASIAVPRRP